MTKAPFDIELAIRAWRRSLKQWRAFFQDDLEELESHIRGHTATLVEEGHSEEKAFRIALSGLGDLASMERAYKQVFWRKLRYQHLLFSTLISHLSMFRNYTLIAIRSLLRHRGYSAVNISGLAIGLACSFLIVLWIQGELSVDQFHERGDDLLQVRINDTSGGKVTTWRNVPFPLADVIESSYPEVERAVLTLPITAALAIDNQATRERGYFAGPGFFEAFTFPMLLGDPLTALKDPGSIVISERVAVKFFGPEWEREAVLGKPIAMNYWQSAGGVLGEAVMVESHAVYTVSGVFSNVPEESSLRFDVVLPVSGVVANFAHVATWGPRWFELSLLVGPGTDIAVFGDKIASVLSDQPGQHDQQQVIVQPLKSAYLHDGFSEGVPSGGRIQQVYLIGLVGLAILLMACINFANLVTARAGGRAREIGVRKAVGAAPSYLIQQFLSEAVLTTLVACAFAIVLTFFVLPFFNAVTGTAVSMSDLPASTWAAFLVIALVTGCLAGSYPAFYLAALQPVRVLRGQPIARRRGEVGMRKALVVLQFGVSALLVVGTLTIYQQLRYLQTTDLGLDKENVVFVRLEGAMVDQYGVLSETLLQSPGIDVVSRTSEDPIGVATKNSDVYWEGKPEEENVLFSVLRTDHHFSQVMKLSLSSGRFFDPDRDIGQRRFVVNESAVAAMGLKDPIGHPFAFGFDLDGEGSAMGQIVGVVKDFHTGSLVDETIGPLVFRYEPERARFLVARVLAGQTPRALADLEKIQSTLNPGYPFEYTFLDEAYQAYYEDEAVLGTLSQMFALVALFIACLGLLGLSAYSVQQRTKEVGVRRVLGATKGQLLVLLSRDFMALVGVALVIALPLAYWAMGSWLESFAYQTPLGVGTLLFAGGLSLAIAMAAVGYQAQRAVRMGPARSLRSE